MKSSLSSEYQVYVSVRVELRNFGSLLVRLNVADFA